MPAPSKIGIAFLERLETFRLPNEKDAYFARRIGIALQTLRNWHLCREANKDFNPQLGAVAEIARSLDISFEWLALGPRKKSEATFIVPVTNSEEAECPIQTQTN